MAVSLSNYLLSSEFSLLLSKLINILIAIFIILIITNLNNIRAVLRNNRDEHFFKVLWAFLKKPAAEFFMQFAEVNRDGTYVFSYENNRTTHKKVRHYLGALFGFALIKVIILVLMGFIIGNFFIFH